MVLEKAAIDKHTRDCVRLFLHGLLPRNSGTERASSAVTYGQRGEQNTAKTFNLPGVTEGQRVKSLEDENRRLKMLLAESMLDVAALKDANTKR
jgi:hypothetical protein